MVLKFGGKVSSWQLKKDLDLDGFKRRFWPWWRWLGGLLDGVLVGLLCFFPGTHKAERNKIGSKV